MRDTTKICRSDHSNPGTMGPPVAAVFRLPSKMPSLHPTLYPQNIHNYRITDLVQLAEEKHQLCALGYSLDMLPHTSL